MMELLASPEAWVSLLTLSALEIVLGIDNVIFLAIVSQRLPQQQRKLARRIGLILALVLRIMLLGSIAWITTLTQPVVTLFDVSFSWRDIVLGVGGLFLLYKATQEIHNEMAGHSEGGAGNVVKVSFAAVIVQIAILDLVFSLDSVITAVGMADHIEIMIAAVVFAIIVMMVAAETVAHFISRNPTVKMLGMAFLLLVGVALVADAMHFHIPRNYLYFAIAFSALVETLNLITQKKRINHKPPEELS
jgi:predicted tellurium resistance membrane protein TerC